MFLVSRDKRKVAGLKGRVWNREIKFKPVLVFGTYEGVGNAANILWKPLNINKITILRNVRKRKHRKNLNALKIRGKSQSITKSQKVITKDLLTVNDQPSSIGEKASNQEKLMDYSSPYNKIYKSINDSVEGENKSLKPHFSYDYSNENEEFFTHNQFITGSGTLDYVVDKLITSEPMSERNYPHNSVEYPNDIDGENKSFKPHFSYDYYSNENEEFFTHNQFITGSGTLDYAVDKLITSEPMSERNYSHNLVEYPNDIDGENKSFKPHFSYDYYSNENEEFFTHNQFITGSGTLDYDVDKLITSEPMSERNYPHNLIEYSSDIDGENKSFKPHFSYDYYSNENEEFFTHNQFITGSGTLDCVEDKLITSEPMSESNYPHNLIEYSSDIDGENSLFKSHFLTDNSNQNKEYISSQVIVESGASKHIPDKFMSSDLNNESNSERIFSVAVSEFPNDGEGENKLFESLNSSDCINQNKEDARKQFITKSETLKNIPDELTKSDEIEFPSDNMIFPNFSQYTAPHSSAFISLEGLKSESDDFYQNIRKNWSLDSSKVLMTPSKESIKSDKSSTSIGYDLMKPGENPNTIESTHKDFIHLLDALDANLNDIIKDHQFSKQTTLKSQDYEDSNLNDLRNDHKTLDRAMVQDQFGENDNLNDHQYKNQKTKMAHDNLNENQFLNNTYAKFIVLKKSRENQETILDSSEDIEKNIFTRNKMSPVFENLISNYLPRTSSKEQKLITEENETDNAARSKIYSLADILHKELTKNYDAINSENKVQPPKVSQELNRPIFENENLACLNNSTEDQTVKDLFNNENIQDSDEFVQKDGRIGSKYEMSLQNSEDDDKTTASSSLPINASQKYFKALSEFTNSLVTTMSKTETLYFEEMMKHGLEHTSGETSGKTTSNPNEKNTRKNENVYSSYFKHGKINHPSSSADSNNNFQIESKEPKHVKDNLLYHLVSKSNHAIEDFDKEFSEIKKKTDEMINKIIRAKTQEELLLLMKPKQKQLEMESKETKDTGETLVRKCTECHTLVDKKEPKHLNNELPFFSVSESNRRTQNINQRSLMDNNNKKFEREESDKAKLNKTFTSSDRSLEKSSDNSQSIESPSCNVKDEKEVPENFRLISEEKEKSSLIMNLQSTHLSHDSSINGSSSDEKSTPAKDENLQNTNLYFLKDQVKSPYITCSKQNMIVNLNNVRKNTILEKIFSCFRKPNFLLKRKSAASLCSKKSNH